MLIIVETSYVYLSVGACPQASSRFVCADSTTFLTIDKVCDHIIDCPDGDDEPGRCRMFIVIFMLVHGK